MIAAALLLAGVVLAGYDAGSWRSAQRAYGFAGSGGPNRAGQGARIVAPIALAKIAVFTIVLLLLVGILLAGATRDTCAWLRAWRARCRSCSRADRYLRQNYDAGAGNRLRGSACGKSSVSIALVSHTPRC